MTKQVFISYSGRDEFEASPSSNSRWNNAGERGVVAWTFQRNQAAFRERDCTKSEHRVRSPLHRSFLFQHPIHWSRG